jgi:hypothetical protein
MGLDQYLRAQEAHGSESEEIGYWRKHPDLHCFIESLWRERNPDQQGDFNCASVLLTEEDILKIIECSKRGSFGEFDGSTGFFFGSTYEEHHQKTVEMMELALKLCRKGKRILYSAWW